MQNRRVSNALAAVALALILVGTLAGGADAKPNRTGANKANEFILACTAQGGDASSIVADGGETTIMCKFADGTYETCTFTNAGMTCTRGVTPIVRGDSVPVVNSGLTFQSGAAGETAPAGSDGARLKPVVSAPARDE